MCNKCVPSNDKICAMTNKIVTAISQIKCKCDHKEIHSILSNIERSLAYNNPMTIGAEFPVIENNKTILTVDVRFLDMLNTTMYIIFKTEPSVSTTSLYIKDSSSFEHKVVTNKNKPITANQIMANGIYKAVYQKSNSCIILNTLIPINPDIIPISI